MAEDAGYVVIARKWRPGTFDQVIGQEHVTRTLGNAIEGGRVAHAYLFTGPRGVGKTTVARVLAKSLNCAEGPTVKPCGKCAPCVEIAQGTSMDVIEIDGASNRGIDEIRNLRESVRYAPVGGKKKIYIIDEVHMLTPEAFNALLKTLEEPPPHVIFVFATTQPLKVPATIVSRCQRFDFRRIPAADIAARLKRICDSEGFTCDDTALALISQRAEGSMRDGQSMLEQVLAFSGGSATEADIRPIVGLRGSEMVSDLARAIMSGEQARVMGLLGDAFDAGVDPLDLSGSLVEWIRFLMIASIDPGSRELLSLTEETRKKLVGEVEGISTEHILSLLSMLTEAEANIKRAGHQRYLLESVLLRMTAVKSIAKIPDLISMLKKTADASASSSEPPGEKSGAEGKGGPGGESGPGGPETAPKPTGPAGRKPAKGGAAKPVGGDMMAMWQDLIEGLRETKASLASILDLCEPPHVSDGVYWLQLPSSFHESQVLKGQNLRILTREMEKLTNTTVVLKTQVKAKAESRDVDLSLIVEKDPVVRALVENLGGKIIGVRQQKKDSSQGELSS